MKAKKTRKRKATPAQLAALKKARAARAAKLNEDLIPVHWTVLAKKRKTTKKRK